jgi:hypothetical protein
MLDVHHHGLLDGVTMIGDQTRMFGPCQVCYEKDNEGYCRKGDFHLATSVNEPMYGVRLFSK